MNKEEKKLVKYFNRQIRKAYFNWYERIYLWFTDFFKKKELTPEKEAGDLFARHIKNQSEILLKKINEDLLKPYNAADRQKRKRN